jgi:RimJ/RimL family protein N-acetyltransferase
MRTTIQIETERLILRTMTLDDTDALLHIFSDPRVMQSFGGIIFDRDRMEQWVRDNLEHQAGHGYGLFSVILAAENLLIGDCGLEHMEIDGRAEVEIGYDMRSAYWGRGFATEAAGAVRDFAFGVLKLPRVISLIRPENVASRRVAEKIGMVREKEIDRGGHPYWIYAQSRTD